MPGRARMRPMIPTPRTDAIIDRIAHAFALWHQKKVYDSDVRGVLVLEKAEVQKLEQELTALQAKHARFHAAMEEIQSLAALSSHRQIAHKAIAIAESTLSPS